MIDQQIPITIPPEVAERIAELGLVSEFDKMLEFTRASIGSIAEIDVSLFDHSFEPTGHSIRLRVIQDKPYIRRDPERQRWRRAIIERFSIPFQRWVSFDLWPREMLNGR